MASLGLPMVTGIHIYSSLFKTEKKNYSYKLSFIPYADFRCCYCPTKGGFAYVRKYEYFEPAHWQSRLPKIGFSSIPNNSFHCKCANYDFKWKTIFLFLKEVHFVSFQGTCWRIFRKKKTLTFIWLNLYRQITAMELKWRISMTIHLQENISRGGLLHNSSYCVCMRRHRRCIGKMQICFITAASLWHFLSADCIPITCNLYASQPCEVFDNMMDRHCKNYMVYLKGP